MRIFIGYHYGPAESWVEEHVYKIVDAFGSTVSHGKNLYDANNLSEGVLAEIARSDAMIAVVSRHQIQPDNFYSTHPWVQQEIGTAKAKKKIVIQLREQQVDPRVGILEGAQYIDYDAANLLDCMVKLTVALGQLHFRRNVPLNLIPSDFRDAISPLLARDGFRFSYCLLDQAYEPVEKDIPAFPVRTPGGMRVYLRALPRDHFIQLKASFGNDCWTSDVESVDSPTVFMQREP